MGRTGLVLASVLLAALPAATRAASPFDDCEAAFAADPQGWKTCGCFHRVATDAALREEAVTRLESHRAADPGNPCLAFTLGRFYQEDRGARDAVPLYRQAAEGYHDRDLPAGEVYARINLSEAFSALGASGDQVTEQLSLAQAAAELAGDPVLDAEVAVKEAKLLLLRGGGDLDLVETSLRRVRREAFPIAHTSLRRDILLFLGEALYRRGRFADAEDVFAQAVEVTAGTDPFGESTARLSLATAVGAQLPDPGRRAEVIPLLEQALTAAQRAGNPFSEIEAHKRLGSLVGGAEGRAHLEAALALAERYRDRAPEILAGVLAASAMDLLADDPDEARRRVDEASTLLLALDDPWAQTYGWANRLRVLWATAPREKALAAAQSTLEIADRLGEVQEAEGSRAEVFSVWTEIYQWLTGRLLEDAETDGDPETLTTAFSVSERMRARLLLESLAAAGVAETSDITRVDPELEAAWRALEHRIVGVHRNLLDPRLSSERRAELLEKLNELEPEEDRLAARRRRLQAADTTRSEELVGLGDLRTSLAENEALLAFQVGLWQALDGTFAGGSWLVAVTRDDVRSYRLPDRVELEPAVTVFLDTFSRRDGLEAEPAAALYDLLLRQALESLPPEVHRLIVVPDGPLHLLPFAALREAPGDPPLAARYEIFVTPSATVWQHLRSLGSPQKNDQPVLAVADPTGPGGVPAGEAAAAGGERSWTAGVRLARLPHAREEGREAVRDLGRPGRLLLGADATERAVKQGTSRGLRLLHLGTHAILDEGHPRRSAVVLAPGADDEDGLLQPREAADLDLGGAVVVLAACQSASGTVLQGEGALSLARSFLEGGARAVIGSLWPVEDEEAADFLGHVYSHLGHGDTLARALARAQREALSAGVPAAAWAGWTVLGDGGAVVAPDGTGRPWFSAWRTGDLVIFLLFAGLTGLAGWAGLVLRKRRS